MESYPKEFISPCLPLILLSGFDAANRTTQDAPPHQQQANGFKIGSESDCVDQKLASSLLDELLKHNTAPYSASSKDVKDRYHFKVCDRVSTASVIFVSKN